MEKFKGKVLKESLFDQALLVLDADGITEVYLLPGEREKGYRLVGKTVTFTGEDRGYKFDAISWEVENGG